MELLTRKEQEKKDRQAYIIKVAEKLIANSSFNETTMDQIAEAAEFAKGTIYHYFNSKEEILYELLSSRTSELSANLEQELHSNNDPLAIIENLIAIHLNFIEKYIDFFKIIIFEQGCSFHQGKEHVCQQKRKSIKQYLNRIDVFTEAFQNAIDVGKIKKGDPKLYAIALRGIMHSFSVQGLYDSAFKKPLSSYRKFIFDTFIEGALT